jgi:MFS family permease
MVCNRNLTDGEIARKKMVSKQTRLKYFFLVLCIIGASAILSSTMSKNPVLNPFAESLGTPEAFMGFVAAASTIPGVLISLPAGSLSDVLGRKKVLLASSIVFASAPFLYIFIISWWQLILVRFYHGFATAVFIPVARASISERYPSKKGERISIFTSATIVGRGLAPLLGGFILSITVMDYLMLYFAVGVAGIVTLFSTLILLKEKDDVSTDRSQEHGKAKSTYGWREVFGNLGIMITSITEAATRFVYGALEFFLVGYFLNVSHLDPSVVGVIMSFQLILIPVFTPLMGLLSDKIDRKIPIIIGLTIGGLSLFAIPYTNQFFTLLVISVIYGFGFTMVISATPALVSDLAPKEYYGASMGFLAATMDVGQMLGPIITGIIIAFFGYSGSFFSLGVILLFFSVLFTIYQRLASRQCGPKSDFNP